jgi:hypothetical protein
LDKAILVGERDSKIPGRVLEALRIAQVPVTLLDWDYSPQLDELQLVIATPLFDSKGPLEANHRVLEALQLAGIYQQTPIKRIFVRSPNDPAVKDLEQELKLRAEGSIHIVRNPNPTNGEKYSLVFTPYRSDGGAVRARIVNGPQELSAFLQNQLEIEPHLASSTIDRLATVPTADIPHVQLNLRQARRLGLA